MVIPQALVDEIIEHARSEFPNEACGILASENGRVVRVYPIRNADESPVHYTMDSQEQLRAMLDSRCPLVFRSRMIGTSRSADSEWTRAHCRSPCRSPPLTLRGRERAPRHAAVRGSGQPSSGKRSAHW